jgi:ribosome-binding protein aMBF1 (putative translation factor)
MLSRPLKYKSTSISEFLTTPASVDAHNVRVLKDKLIGGSDTLASRLCKARRKARISQATLAASVGMLQASISQLETGVHLKSPKLAQIATALKVDLHWLKTGETLKKKSKKSPQSELPY